MPTILVFGRLKQEDCFEFKSSLSYRNAVYKQNKKADMFSPSPKIYFPLNYGGYGGVVHMHAGDTRGQQYLIS